MSLFKVALLQMFAHGIDEDENIRKGELYCRKASDLGADIALFPEMWNIGYMGPFEDAKAASMDPQQQEMFEQWKKRAITADDKFIAHFRCLAKELDMAIAVTYLEKWNPLPRNSVSIIDRHGELIMTYAKVHTCDFSMEGLCTHGESFPVCSLDTHNGSILIGVMICFDREFPESARILMLNGAEIVLVPNACPMDENRISQIKTRAYENMVGIAMTNYPGPNSGHSVAFHGMAFTKDGQARNTLVVEAGEMEDLYMATFDIDEIRDYREREVWGNAYRKPSLYNELLSPNVNSPFIRHNVRR